MYRFSNHLCTRGNSGGMKYSVLAALKRMGRKNIWWSTEHSALHVGTTCALCTLNWVIKELLLIILISYNCISHLVSLTSNSLNYVGFLVYWEKRHKNAHKEKKNPKNKEQVTVTCCFIKWFTFFWMVNIFHWEIVFPKVLWLFELQEAVSIRKRTQKLKFGNLIDDFISSVSKTQIKTKWVFSFGCLNYWFITKTRTLNLFEIVQRKTKKSELYIACVLSRSWKLHYFSKVLQQLVKVMVI